MLLKIRCNFGQNYGFFRLNLDLDALKGFQTSKQVSKHLFQIIWILYALFKFSNNERYFIKLFNNENWCRWTCKLWKIWSRDCSSLYPCKSQPFSKFSRFELFLVFIIRWHSRMVPKSLSWSKWGFYRHLLRLEMSNFLKWFKIKIKCNFLWNLLDV